MSYDRKEFVALLHRRGGLNTEQTTYVADEVEKLLVAAHKEHADYLQWKRSRGEIGGPLFNELGDHEGCF